MELNYKVFGSGEPVIILHGLFGMLDNWQTIAKEIAQNGFEVFILDLRNHGKSPHSNEFNYQIMTRDLLDFLEEQNIFKCHLIGHSMGGKLALQFAALYQGYINSLIIVDIFPKSYKQIRIDHQKIFNAIHRINEGKFIDRNKAENAIKTIITNERIYMFMLKNLRKNENENIVWKFNSEVIEKNYDQIKNNIILPSAFKSNIIFIKAANSDYIDNKDLTSKQALFPNGKMEIIANSGHWVHVDQRKKFLQICLSFLKS